MKKLILIPILFLMASPAYAQSAAKLSQLQVIEVDHSRYVAAANVMNIHPESRVILGNAEDYKRFGYSFPAAALTNAELTFIRINNHSAMLHIANLGRAKKTYYLVLKQPETDHLYAYVIRNYSEGSFDSPLVADMTYGDSQVDPRLAAINPHTKLLPIPANAPGFPAYPKPSIGNFHARRLTVAMRSVSHKKKSTKASSKNVGGLCASAGNAQLDKGLIALNSPAMKAFASLANKYLSNAHMIHVDGNSYLKVPAPHMLAMASDTNIQSAPNPWKSETASYHADSETSLAPATDYFGWTKTVKYVVKKNDMSISDVVKDIKLDSKLSNDAVIAAIWQMNKSSFGDRTIYTLMKGAVLNIPPRYVVVALQNDPAKLRQLIEQATGEYTSYF